MVVVTRLTHANDYDLLVEDVVLQASRIHGAVVTDNGTPNTLAQHRGELTQQNLNNTVTRLQQPASATSISETVN